MALRESRIKTLLLSLVYPSRASYYNDWRDAFTSHPAFDCTELNILGLAPDVLARHLGAADAIITLHSCNADTLDYFATVAPVLGERRRGRLLSFVGNEYNSPYFSVPERTRLLGIARADVVATQLLQEAGAYLYGSIGARVVAVPHALNPNAFKPGPAAGARSIDIGVKGYRYPAFLGDDDRNRFLASLSATGPEHGLKVDISEDKRLGRAEWADFLGQCRGTVSTEAGSWFIAPNDEFIGRIAAYLRERHTGLVISNDSWLRRAARHLPSPVKSLLWAVTKHGPVKFEVTNDNAVPFDELYERFFRDTPRPSAYGKAISSRHFDAIGTKTCQIMLRGRFNDILVANEHYIAVDPDHGNVADALRRFNDVSQRRRITENAYELVLSGHTYAHRAAFVHRLLTE